MEHEPVFNEIGTLMTLFSCSTVLITRHTFYVNAAYEYKVSYKIRVVKRRQKIDHAENLAVKETISKDN